MTTTMKKRHPSESADCGPIHLEIDVPPIGTEPARLYRVSLDATKAALVRLAAEHLGMPLDRFLQACLSGSLRVEVLPLPAARVARWQRGAVRQLAKVSPAKLKRLAKAARERGFATVLDLVTDHEWRDFVQVRVSTGGRHRQFPRTLWSRVEEFVGVRQPSNLVQMPTASAPPQALAA